MSALGRMPGATGARLTTLAKSIHKTLAANAKELAKQANRDPAVYKAAVDSAIAAINIESVDTSRASRPAGRTRWPARPRARWWATCWPTRSRATRAPEYG